MSHSHNAAAIDCSSERRWDPQPTSCSSRYGRARNRRNRWRRHRALSQAIPDTSDQNFRTLVRLPLPDLPVDGRQLRVFPAPSAINKELRRVTMPRSFPLRLWCLCRAQRQRRDPSRAGRPQTGGCGFRQRAFSRARKLPKPKADYASFKDTRSALDANPPPSTAPSAYLGRKPSYNANSLTVSSPTKRRCPISRLSAIARPRV
jgi:hypothetical protein